MKIKFGTDGFRGYIGKDFTFDNALKVAKLALTYFKKDRNNHVAVGYDTRFLSKEVAVEIAKTSKQFGFKTLLSDSFVPSPAISLFIHKKKLSFGIMVTASHNPPQFNGVKIKENYGGSAITRTMEGISKVVLKEQHDNKEGVLKTEDIRDFYLSYLKNCFNLSSYKDGLKILVNPMFGASQGCMSELLKDTKFEVKEINSVINPSFGGINPEPTEENLAETKKIMGSLKYDVGFAFDGDGDRISAFDDKGSFYSSQRLLPLFLHYLVTVKKETGVVVKTVSTSSMLRKVAESHGLKVEEVPIGFKNIVPLFLSKKALIGGEESGGIAIKGYIPERDGVYCALTLLEILAHYKKPLSEIWKEMEQLYGTYVFKREDYHFEDENTVRKILDKLDFDDICRFKVTSKNFIDGRKFLFGDDNFLLIRVSGTEPVVRVYCECNSKSELEDVFDWAKRMLRKSGVSC